MTPQERKVMELALEVLTHLRPSALTSFYTIGDRDKATIAIKEVLAQPAVAEQHKQRTWVGLTDEEIERDYYGRHDFVRAVELRIKEKNA